MLSCCIILLLHYCITTIIHGKSGNYGNYNYAIFLLRLLFCKKNSLWWYFFKALIIVEFFPSISDSMSDYSVTTQMVYHLITESLSMHYCVLWKSMIDGGSMVYINIQSFILSYITYIYSVFVIRQDSSQLTKYLKLI